MLTLGDNPAFVHYALATAILVLKMLGSAWYTGAQRNRTEGYVNPEDAARFGKGATAQAEERPEVAHALRIQRNDLENIPLFFALGLVYVLAGASPTGAAAYCWTFTAARVLHTIFYVQHLQPHRALAYLLGSLCLIGMAVSVLVMVL